MCFSACPYYICHVCLYMFNFVSHLKQPKVDEDHPTWLHLQIREFEPKFRTSKFRGYHAAKSSHIVDGRWTLGFPDAKACEAARLSVLEETRKLRSSVESFLAPLLQNNCLGNLSESEDD